MAADAVQAAGGFYKVIVENDTVRMLQCRGALAQRRRCRVPECNRIRGHGLQSPTRMASRWTSNS